MSSSSRIKRLLAAALAPALGASLLLAALHSASAAQAPPAYLRQVRVIETAALGVARPIGLAYAPPEDVLLVLAEGDAPGEAGRVALLTPLVEPARLWAAPAPQLRQLLDARPRAHAADPGDGRRYRLGAGRALDELGPGGEIVATRDLSALQLYDPRDIVFAPSGDPTDDPAATSLYIADAGSPDGKAPGRIVEVELAEPRLVAMPPAQANASLVRTIATSEWSPPSPDPSDIAYLPASGRLLISDGEVDEMPQYFAGANVYEATLAGALERTYSTLGFSDEPTGVAVDPAGGRLFFSDDNEREIYEVAFGPDGQYGTGDDIVTSFKTRPFGCRDPEGLAFGAGTLFIADGSGREIYRVAPGPNGRFDGVAPDGDDQVTHFDTASLGQQDPEGVEYNAAAGTLFIISNSRRSDVVETTLDGDVLRVIDLEFVGARAPAGLAYAPSSGNPSALSLYIVDRNIDNNDDPNENDGKIYEIAIPPSAPPEPTPAPAPTPTLTPPAPARMIYLPIARR